MRDKHQNADSLSKKTEFYERLEQKQANQAEIREGFSFLNKETYEALLLTRWLDKSGHPITGHPELPVEKAAEMKILSKKDPVPLNLLQYLNLIQQELSRMNINSLSLLDKTVQVTPQVMRMLGVLLEREVTRDDPVSNSQCENKDYVIKTSTQRKREGLSDNSSATSVLDTPERLDKYIIQTKRTGGRDTKETRHFTGSGSERRRGWSKRESLSWEKVVDRNMQVYQQDPGQESLSGKSGEEENVQGEEQDMEDKILSGEIRWMSRAHKSDPEGETCSATDSSVEDNSRNSGIGTYSDRNSSTESYIKTLIVIVTCYVAKNSL